MKKKMFLLLLVIGFTSSFIFAQGVNNGRNLSSQPRQIITNTDSFNHPPKLLLKTGQDNNTKQYIGESLYVDGRLGIGYDIEDNVSLSYSSLLIRENSIRLLFDDSSIMSGFPLNDWAININDADENGDEYFDIEDVTAGTVPFKILAGAGDNALYVGSYGNIGFGTGNPVMELHIADGDTPGIRLDQDGTSMWTEQVWDVAANETNFFIRDVTGGSSLPFRIQSGTPSSTLSLKTGGFVGIGTWSPTTHLDVKGHIRTDSTMLFNPLVEMPANDEGRIFMDGNEHKIKYYDGTKWVSVCDSQSLLDASLTGTVLQIDIENGTSVSIDLQPLIADLETRVADLEAIVLGKESVKYSSARLFQNSPNPYKNTTTISYFIPFDVENAVLKISSVKGDLIKDVIINERGEGSLIIDGSETNIGTYFYTLIVDGQKIASKTLVKID